MASRDDPSMDREGWQAMTATDPAAAIVAKLEAGGYSPRPTGPDAWESRCPAHDGRRRNLSVKRGHDGRALLFCHRQPTCKTAAILAELGMTMGELFPADSPRVQTNRNGKTTRLKVDHGATLSGNGKAAKPNPHRRAYPTPE